MGHMRQMYVGPKIDLKAMQGKAYKDSIGDVRNDPEVVLIHLHGAEVTDCSKYAHETWVNGISDHREPINS